MQARILIVEDNPTNLKLAADVLESAGFVIERATNAEQALAILDRCLPHLILMDIALPGMDGLSLTRHLKGTSRWRDIPVVALTAFAMKGDEARARAAGCEGYISKPIESRKLAAQVAGYLRAPH